MNQGSNAPLAQGLPPEWAVEWGEDRHGVFLGFAVGAVVQRMRWIPPGAFRMGSPPNEDGRFDYEGPQHEVRFTRGFWLADTPVTQALWQAVMGSNPSGFAGEDHAQRPVETVSWEDCRGFVVELNRRLPELNACLPSEAAWEYACRAGSGEAARYGALSEVAWFNKNSKDETHPVRQKAPNDWGLYDMLGNVWEWCETASEAYRVESRIDPPWDTEGTSRVYRGGSWLDSARSVRAACRGWTHPGDRGSDLGFRLARGPAPAEHQEGPPRAGVRSPRP